MRDRDQIVETATRHVEAGAFASIEWRVERNGEPFSSGAIGQADPLNNVALPDQPIYRIYSMTKPVISAIAMMLIEEGRLHLANPVAAFVKAFAGVKVLVRDGDRWREESPQTPPTIAHLMTHTAGLSYGFLPDCPVGEMYRKGGLRDKGQTLESMVEKIAEYPLAFEPGSEWRYSVATDVLARVIEIVEGKPIQTVVADRVTQPLGLNDTAFMVRESERHRLMPMFGEADINKLMVLQPGAQKLTPANVDEGYPCDDADFGRGGYGLFSTADENMVVARFLATGKAPDGVTLLSRKAVELMWANRIAEPLRPLSIGNILLPGYGFSLAGRTMVAPGLANVMSSAGECGWSGAASTYFIIDPREDLIAVVMSQYLGSKIRLADDMHNAIYAML